MMKKGINEMNKCKCMEFSRYTSKICIVHHKNCAFYDPEGDARTIIEGLIKGIEKLINMVKSVLI